MLTIFARGHEIRYMMLIAVLSLIPAVPMHGQPKTPPRMQAVPQADDQLEFQRDGQLLARYHFGASLKRPYLFPIIGPSGRPLTRIGHPHDPAGHSHHNSVWISHNDINGVVFWGDAGKGRIVQRKVEKLTDDDAEASITTLNAWVDEGSGKTLLLERRKITAQNLDKGESMIIIDLQFEPGKDGKNPPEPVVFGKTPFGMIGVRMAKSIGVNDGGGTMRNSGGMVNEKEIFWKPARWVDCSGAIAPNVIEGITLLDHPINPNHPTVWHVRNDGWMGAALTHGGPYKLEPGKSLRLRYGLYVHAGQPAIADLEARWASFASAKVGDLTPIPKKAK